MDEFVFKALGTQWSILVDGAHFPETDRQLVRKEIECFEDAFSRFRMHSQANRFRNAKAGVYVISEEMGNLLLRCVQLRNFTNGAYDPAIGRLLELKGYDQTYSLKESEAAAYFNIPKWQLEDGYLFIDGPVVFDFGGIGKGLCIDMVVGWLRERGYPHVLVDGGGDLCATTKVGGEPWLVAVQYPGKANVVAGSISLSNQALAVSDVFKRKWGKNHHIISADTKNSIEKIIGIATLAKNAWDADCATSGLFLAPEENHHMIEKAFGAESLIFLEDGSCAISTQWPGEVYTA